MNATLIESPDEHHWVLLDHRVVRIAVEADAVTLQTWSLDASAEVRVSAPFTLRLASGQIRSLDPEHAEGLAPLLALLRSPVRGLTVSRGGELSLSFGDGSSLVVPPSARYAAWEVNGGGVMEGVAYRCPPGGGPLWN